MIETALTAVIGAGHESLPSLLWAAALVVGLSYAVRAARIAGLDTRVAYWAGFLAIGAGLIGSRLLGMVVYAEGSDVAWSAILDGGRSYYGGLILGASAAIAFLGLRRVRLLPYADALAPASALGYAVGRLGCLFNGDDYGIMTSLPLAVRYPPTTEAYIHQLSLGLIDRSQALSLPVLPIQLGHVALGLILFFATRRPRAPAGTALGIFAVGYGIGRFAIELARGDFQAVAGPLSLHQIISLALGGAGALALVVSRTRAPFATARVS